MRSLVELPGATLTSVIREVGARAEREKHLQVRLSRRGGEDVFSQSIGLGPDAVVAVVDDETSVVVPFEDIESIHVGSPNRKREAVLAVLSIVVMVSLLTLASALPWGHFEAWGIPLTSLVVFLVGVLAFEFLVADRLARWRQVYPPPRSSTDG